MLLVGLTGGIASGKSTVSAMLAERGAIVLDADLIAREIVEPGQETWSKIVEHFGPQILAQDRKINREKLASIVFADPVKRALLNELTHPKVMAIIADRLEDLRPTASIVVCDIPLLTEVSGASSMFDLVVVVQASPQTQIDRLTATRAMSAGDAAARIDAQASAQERRALADIVIDNDGDRASLTHSVEQLWNDLKKRAAIGRDASS